MPLLTIREAYTDHPNFQAQVEAAQSRVLSAFDGLSLWVERYRSILNSLKEFQIATTRMTANFKALGEGVYREGFDPNKVDRMARSIDLIFNTHTALLETMDREVLEPAVNIQTRLREVLSVRQEKFLEEQKELERRILTYTGLMKRTADTEEAANYVTECNQLYAHKVAKCQKYMDWIGYLNQIQAGSELWWSLKSCQFFDRLTRWHSDCLACLRASEPTLEAMSVQLNEHPEATALDIPQASQTAEEIFRANFAKYRHALGLPGLDLLDAPMLRCALEEATDKHERSGYLLFNLDPTESWRRGFFEINHRGRLSLVPAVRCRIEMEPIELRSATLNEVSHPSRQDVFQLSTAEVDSVRVIYLQAESALDKDEWLRVFQTYVKGGTNKGGTKPRLLNKVGLCFIIIISVEDVSRVSSTAISRDQPLEPKAVPTRTSCSHPNLSKPTAPIRGLADERQVPNHSGSPRAVSVSSINDSEGPGSSPCIKLEEEPGCLRPSNDEVIKTGHVQIREFKSAKPREAFNHNQPSSIGSWRKVRLILKSNGILYQYHKQDDTILSTFDLKELPRFNIRPLDPSYFHNPSSLEIEEAGKEPWYFKLETVVERNGWLCLLKSFAQPEVLGRVLPIPKVYRICRSFQLRIVEGRNFASAADLYCQVALDGTLASFTSSKPKSKAPFWREDFLFDDLAPFREGVTIHLLTRNRYQKDTRVGRTTIPIRSIRPGRSTRVEPKPSAGLFLSQSRGSKRKGSVPNLSTPKPKGLKDGTVADLRLKLRYDEVVVLKSSEYAALLELLMDFGADVVYDLVVGPKYLDWVAETLLKIYCARHRSVAWLNYLAEGEVQATDDPNLLFRGNTILTKAIDAYMKMVGLQYVDETIGGIVREVCKRKVSCEVDVAKLRRPEDAKRQWKTLLSYAHQLFEAIQGSKDCCPPELRCFFHHLRKASDDKFGDSPALLESTKYTCVSGFLFLRLFCPAVLSPKLFGLVREHPDAKTLRTLTLLAKSLQCLANLADFGVKEPYMLQMNDFIADNTAKLMAFIDFIALIPVPSRLGRGGEPNGLPAAPAPHRVSRPAAPFVIDLDRELSFLSGYVARNTRTLKLTAADTATRASKPGKLERLISVCNTIDFIVKDCVQSGAMDTSKGLP
ncbi:hypothetical protein L0F63_004339 [Massospora cicadina]|nr:hypothetical protein L0F63_004339 [Massospora cicadina]